MITLTKKSDSIGAIASSLCLIHCLATPLLFIAQSCSAVCCSSETVPGWWQWLDYAFLAISFFAIFWSTKTTSKDWMKIALWVSWAALLLVIVNEKTEWFPMKEFFIYIPALSLVALHLYNRKFCQCSEEECCVDQ